MTHSEKKEPLKSVEDLTKDNREKLEEIRVNNKIYLENIRKVYYEKLEDDVQTQAHNARIINKLSAQLVKWFFGEYMFCWVAAYTIIFLCFEKLLELVNSVGLFLLVFILGKFLKDQIGILINKK